MQCESCYVREDGVKGWYEGDGGERCGTREAVRGVV